MDWKNELCYKVAAYSIIKLDAVFAPVSNFAQRRKLAFFFRPISPIFGLLQVY